jgi:methylamine dehydrogenase heavy chain
VVLTFDARTMQPIGEVEIPPKSAGIGHSGMIGLVGGRFIAVWNITPAMSVSVVDTAQNEFVGEISTPGCAAIYPVGMGFLMPCGDGALQYVALNDDGTEASRTRSRSFYSVSDDPVYDYAVPTESGWLFLSFDGQVFEATWNDGEITVSEPWSIISENAEEDEEEKGWRIGGNQPFAYNPETGLLVTLMHQGGGQETFESAGTQAWGFDLAQQRRGYRLALEAPAVGLQLTQDARPLLIVSPEEDGTLRIHDGLSGRKLRDVTEIGGGLIQNLSAAGP